MYNKISHFTYPLETSSNLIGFQKRTCQLSAWVFMIFPPAAKNFRSKEEISSQFSSNRPQHQGWWLSSLFAKKSQNCPPAELVPSSWAIENLPGCPTEAYSDHLLNLPSTLYLPSLPAPCPLVERAKSKLVVDSWALLQLLLITSRPIINQDYRLLMSSIKNLLADLWINLNLFCILNNRTCGDLLNVLKEGKNCIVM